MKQADVDAIPLVLSPAPSGAGIGGRERPREASLLGPALWRTSRGRRTLWQGGATVALALLLVGFVVWIRATLADLNLGLGFDFLHRTAGISISETLLPFGPEDSIGRLVVAGAMNSLRLSILACVAATLVGLAVGVMRLSSNALLAGLTGLYVAVVRNTPLLLQILFWYAVFLALPPVRQALSIGDVVFFSQRGLQLPSLSYVGGPALAAGAIVAALAVGLGLGRLARPATLLARRSVGIVAAIVAATAVLIAGEAIAVTVPKRQGFNFAGGLSLTPEFAAIVIAQSAYAAAFIAELVRGGIESVAPGQKEAGAALGLSPGQVMRLVVVPQALLVIVPSVTTQYVAIIKNSSLAIAIGFPDLFWALSSSITITGHSIEGITLMVAAYLVPTLLAAFAMDRFNRRLVARGQRRKG